MTTAIKVENVTKEFILRHTHSLKETVVWSLKGKKTVDSFAALKGVSFEVENGENTALLGYNGSGKSTLLKVISGVLRPDAGRVGLGGSVAGLIEVGAGLHPDLTGRENIFMNAAILGMSKPEIEQAYDSIVAFSEIEKFIDQEVKFYSSGMFLRLAFSVAVHTEPEIFLVDEILSVGDEPFQRKCLAKIRELNEQGRTLLIVSHDLDQIANLCDRAIVLDHGAVLLDDTAKNAVDFMRSR